MPTIQITLPINLSFVIGSFLMSAITNSEHSTVVFVEQFQKTRSFKQRIDLIAGPPDVRGIVFNAKSLER